jgi:glucose-1-phosphate adenylyltransferase
MGNDHYQTLQEIALNPDDIPKGVGYNCHIEHAILDKDCQIGNNVVIKGGDHLPDMDGDGFCVRDGIVVVKKGGVLPDGTRIM